MKQKLYQQLSRLGLPLLLLSKVVSVIINSKEKAFENFLSQFDLSREDLTGLGEPNDTTVDRYRRRYLRQQYFDLQKMILQ